MVNLTNSVDSDELPHNLQIILCIMKDEMLLKSIKLIFFNKKNYNKNVCETLIFYLA